MVLLLHSAHTHTVLGYAKYAQSIFPKCLNYVQRDGVSFLAQEEEEEEKSHPGRIQIFFVGAALKNMVLTSKKGDACQRGGGGDYKPHSHTIMLCVHWQTLQ